MFDWNYYKIVCAFGEWVVIEVEKLRERKTKVCSNEEILIMRTKHYRYNTQNAALDTLYYYTNTLPGYMRWFQGWSDVIYLQRQTNNVDLRTYTGQMLLKNNRTEMMV